MRHLMRAVNFGAFLFACAILIAAHFAWLGGQMSEPVMLAWSGAGLVGLVVTIVGEAKLRAAPQEDA